MPRTLLKAKMALNDGLLDFRSSFETSLNWNDFPHHITTDWQPYVSHLPAIYSRNGSWQLTQEIFACAVCTGHNASPHHVLILLDETDQVVYTIMTLHFNCSLPTAQPVHYLHYLEERCYWTFLFILRLVISTRRHYCNGGQQFVLKIVISTKYSVYQEYLGSYYVRWTQAGLAWLIHSSYTMVTTNERGTYTSVPQ